jgi:hypothetical protein
VEKIEERRPLGRPRRRWGIILKQILKEMPLGGEFIGLGSVGSA